MNITITPEAFAWFQDEMGLVEGDELRFHIRYDDAHSAGRDQHGFSLLLTVEPPRRPGASVEAGGIRFFVEEGELWYFDGQDLRVEWDERDEMLRFITD
ncbi:HesB/YadR/YfhF family protein [Desmospora profundinema]|uniref:Uncharacterized protein YneR n=1 Tax=Desmospora profundinema TaxID=1571184 RepID=A0ABU1INB1_9BACL|nr:hypothetical protein [Desmospora profundinema]MDR6226271.1 uncharacterized protein YneR [Desmospora profundinema]